MTPAVPWITVIRRSFVLAASMVGAAALAAACAPAGNPPAIAVNVANALVTQVIATGYDAGRSASPAVGSDGAPFVSYLLLQPTLAEGQLAPAVVPNTPQPPAVVVASFDSSKGFWTRTSASPQDYAKAQGKEATIADKDGKFLPGVNQAMAVDGQGKQHVVWATPSGLFYTNDVAGSAFSDPEQVTKSPVTGASIAVDKAGAAYVAYYDGDNVMLATKATGSWASQSVSLVTSCASCPPVRTAIAVDQSSGAITVAFVDGGSATPSVATAQAPASGSAPSSWSVTRFGSGTGGFGISVALSKDGSPTVAYVGSDGRAYLATGFGQGGSGGTPTPNAVSSVAAASGADPSGWTTGVGVDDSGKVYATWVDPAANDVVLGTGSPGSLKTDVVPQSRGGRQPALAVSGDGKTLVLPFYDTTNHQLAVAIPAAGGIAIGVPSPTPSPPPTAPAGPACQPTDSTQLSISAKNIAFSTSCLAVVPGTAFTVAFANQDAAGTPHNWDLYKDPGYTQHIGGAASPTDLVTAPGQTSYSVDALGAGLYYFKCDVHPNMTGQLVVAPLGGSPQPGPSNSP